ncbi:UNVERIFIED_CONTAM: CYTH domain-containing protein [Streptococcus canis]|uniref:CYTH domain-containing protein n=2 Tax=Streptococcus canis TaxID=1329 RepID=A0AAE4TTC2_STRCB|nr:CYTH domain-containing protein [Streptococcus canis]EIQ82026.1 organic phosphate binding CYTH family protein [Streptococcus canis FSL Z3-227]MDV5977852.1 CYTH domain-containing protein [Streptococcus canis]MDV5988000.1 CYTH domain-containing protein [Streptococcus canis]MDV5993105.1 CYTH domain-containing protein [Streptococcus canis]MDV6001249.1 CYTH domain-containing protein [Streptococcus canis]
MTNLEIEYKTLLTKDEYNRLLSQMSHVTPITQTNYYIDTEQFDLKAHKMSLRIRTFSNSAELTLKVPEKVGNREYNVPLALDQAKDMIKYGNFPQSSALDVIASTGIDLTALKTFGNLTTIRRETETPIGKMALDYNQYANTKDYELELEVTDPIKGKIDFDLFLTQHQIAFKYAKSKVARFSKTLKKTKK